MIFLVDCWKGIEINRIQILLGIMGIFFSDWQPFTINSNGLSGQLVNGREKNEFHFDFHQRNLWEKIWIAKILDLALFYFE